MEEKKTKIKCKEDFILNPKTGRCIQKEGVLAKKLGLSPSKPKIIKSPKTTTPKITTPKNKSPKTKSPKKSPLKTLTHKTPKTPPRKTPPRKTPRTPLTPKTPRKRPLQTPSPKTHKKPKTPKTPVKSSPYLDVCYTFNGIKICRHKKSRYFEKQQRLLCGLHALNNLFQNQTLIDPPKTLFTKEELDDICKKINFRDPRRCNEAGYYSFQVLEHAIKKFDDLFTSTYLTDEGFNLALDDLQNSEDCLGAIILYDSHVGRHFVSIIPEGDKFLVIDSTFKHGNLVVIDTRKEVKKYFENFLEILVVYKY